MMYKLSITTLEALKEALENSNSVLIELRGTNDLPWVSRAINKNDEQIKILTEQYHITNTLLHNG
jgi:hypothetical protein